MKKLFHGYLFVHYLLQLVFRAMLPILLKGMEIILIVNVGIYSFQLPKITDIKPIILEVLLWLRIINV